MKARHVAIALWVMTSLGCGSSAEPTVAPAPTVTPSRPAPETPIANTPPASQARHARPTIPVETRLHLQTLIRGARTAARAGNWANASTMFEQALAIQGGSRLRCESGYAAFRAGDTARAKTLITQALASFPERVTDELRVPIAMCLYNAGLVYESGGDTTRAREAYERSIALRPHPTVQAKLDALGAAVATPASASMTFAPNAAWDVIAQSLGAAWCRDGGLGFEAGTHCDTVGSSIRSPTGAPSTATLEARLVLLHVSDLGEDERVVLAVRDGQRTLAFSLADLYSPGAAGMTAGYQIESFEMRDVIPGGNPEVVLRLMENDNDEDMGVCERHGGSETDLVVCSNDGGSIACAALPVLRDMYFEFDEDMCEGQEDVEPHADEHDGYEVRVALDAGTATVTRVSQSGNLPIPQGYVGRAPITTLLRQFALEPL